MLVSAASTLFRRIPMHALKCRKSPFKKKNHHLPIFVGLIIWTCLSPFSPPPPPPPPLQTLLKLGSLHTSAAIVLSPWLQCLAVAGASNSGIAYKLCDTIIWSLSHEDTREHIRLFCNV